MAPIHLYLYCWMLCKNFRTYKNVNFIVYTNTIIYIYITKSHPKLKKKNYFWILILFAFLADLRHYKLNRFMCDFFLIIFQRHCLTISLATWYSSYTNCWNGYLIIFMFLSIIFEITGFKLSLSRFLQKGSIFYSILETSISQKFLF